MTSTSLFDRWALTYDHRSLQTVAYRPIHDAILARLDGVSPSTILDLGCGTGQLTLRLTETFPNATIVAVDLSAGMLAKAANRLHAVSSDRCAIVMADAGQLPLAPSSVDVAVCTESFHWYRDQLGTLAGLAHVVRPGGRLLIASTAMTTGVGDALVRRVTKMSGRPIRAVPPARLRRMLDTTGFAVTDQRRIPRLGPAGWPVLTDALR